MNPEKIWQTTLAELQLSLSKGNFLAWFSKTKILNIEKVGFNKQTVTIAVNNPFTKSTIETKYTHKVKEILNKITGVKNELKIVVKSNDFSSSEKISSAGPLFTFDYQKEKKEAYQKARKRVGLRPDFTFDNFAVSSTNELAYAAAQAVAQKPGKVYHLLFLYGGVGVGKTHLMQAIGHKILENNPETPIIYSTAEEFTNEIINAIRTKNTSSFQKKYRSAKVLLIDDVQFIGGKERVQEEFFHTFNAVHKEEGQIVLTSDKMPDQIEGLEARLQSRFEGGLTIDIQEPNFELRTAILLIKAKQRGISLSMDVAQLIASQIESTRKLEGFLIRLITESQAKKTSITTDLVQKILGKAVKKEKTLPFLKPKKVLETVASYFNISVDQLRGKRRLKEVVVPRQIAMFLLRTELGLPLVKIGEIFGGKDHTTVMHSVEKIQKEFSVSETIKTDIDYLKKKMAQI